MRTRDVRASRNRANRGGFGRVESLTLTDQRYDLPAVCVSAEYYACLFMVVLGICYGLQSLQGLLPAFIASSRVL